MKNENPVKNDLILISQNSSNDFLLLFSDIKEQSKLLHSFSAFINEYFDLINNFNNKLKEITNNHLNENIFKSSMENLPIFRLGKAIKDIVQTQLNKLTTIIENQNIFKGIDKDFSELVKLIKEYKTISGDTSKGHDSKSVIQPVVLSLIETYNDIEYKIINDYIIKKYNKRIVGEKKDIDLEEKLLVINYLEKTFLEFGESSKNLFFKEFQEIQRKTLNSFNIIKEHMKILAEIILKQNYINYYEIQNEIDFIGKNSKIKNEDITRNYNSTTPTENNNMFKHRINILNNPNIKVIDIEKEKHKNELANNSKEMNVETQEKKRKSQKLSLKNNTIEKNKEKEQKPEQNLEEMLTLKDEDIYNIVEQLYSFNMKMLDYSEYILDIEKKKIEVVKLSKKLLSFNDKKQTLEEITDSEVDCLIELLKNNEGNIHKFFILLNNFRTTGRYEIKERTYNILIKIFNMTQDFLLEKRNLFLGNLIIILSQTFFIMKNEKKNYIVNDIRNHKIFKEKEFWKNQLKCKIEELLEKSKKDIQRMNLNLSEKEIQRRKDEAILSQFVPFSTNMKEFGLNSDIILNIANEIFEAYNTGCETRTLIISLVKN